MTSLFLGADGTVFAHLTVAVWLQTQRCPLLTYLYISSTTLQLVYTVQVLCFWRRKQQAKGSKSHSPDYRAVQPGFKQCLLPVISWHKSKLYKRQMISPEACRGFFFIWGLTAQFLGLTFSHKSSRDKNVLLNHWKSREKQSVVVRA